MANLKELRNKIGGIQSIRKVTSAMKLVAGVKLRKAEQKAVASRDYAAELGKVLSGIHRDQFDVPCELLCGREVVKNELLMVFASDRGFCGNFNYLVYKAVLDQLESAKKSGRNILIWCVGAKIHNILKHRLSKDVNLELIPEFFKAEELLNNSNSLGHRIVRGFREHQFDEVSMLFTRYYSVMRRTVQIQELIPVKYEESRDRTTTIFEPDIESVLCNLLPFNIGVQIYQAALESVASEQSARMSSMDNATRNADDMLSGLKIKYNRTRQQGITQELTEIVSGAEAISNG